MGLDSRDYSRRSGGGGFGSGGVDGVFRLLNWSLGIGSLFDVRIRIHITFILLTAVELLRADDRLAALRWTSLLFASVLLHEFGHVTACRKVGGTADEILMWPLGGLALTAPPRDPWAHFWTTLWGPLVSLLLAAASYLYISMRFGFEEFVSVNPWEMLRPGWSIYLRGEAPGTIDLLVRDFFYVNYVLLLFNLLLVFFPFDGGRLIQEFAWMRIGYVKSMWWASRIGMAGAVIVALLGLLLGHLFLVFIAAFGFYACYQQKLMLQYEGGGEVYENYGYSGRPDRRGWWARWQARRQQQRNLTRQQESDRLQQEVDRILDKVNREGLHSLSAKERKTLQRATELQRRG